MNMNKMRRQRTQNQNCVLSIWNWNICYNSKVEKKKKTSAQFSRATSCIPSSFLTHSILIVLILLNKNPKDKKKYELEDL